MAERKETLVIDLKVVDNASKALKGAVDTIDKSIAALGGTKGGPGKTGGQADVGSTLEKSSDVVLQNMIRARKELADAGKLLEKNSLSASQNLGKAAKIFQAGAQGRTFLGSIGGMMQAGGAPGGTVAAAGGAMAGGGGLLSGAGAAIGTAIAPGPGTAIGSAIGGMVEMVGGAVSKAFMGVTDAIKGFVMGQVPMTRITGMPTMAAPTGSMWGGAELHGGIANMIRTAGFAGGGAKGAFGRAWSDEELLEFGRNASRLGLTPGEYGGLTGGFARFGGGMGLGANAAKAIGNEELRQSRDILIARGMGGTRLTENLMNTSDIMATAARGGARLDPRSIALAMGNVSQMGGVFREMAPGVTSNIIEGARSSAATGGGSPIDDFRVRAVARALGKKLGRAVSWDEAQEVLAGEQVEGVGGPDFLQQAFAQGAMAEGRSEQAQGRIFAQAAGLGGMPQISRVRPLMRTLATSEIGDAAFKQAAANLTEGQREAALLPTEVAGVGGRVVTREVEMERLKVADAGMKLLDKRLQIEIELIKTGGEAVDGIDDMIKSVKGLTESVKEFVASTGQAFAEHPVRATVGALGGMAVGGFAAAATGGAGVVAMPYFITKGAKLVAGEPGQPSGGKEGG